MNLLFLNWEEISLNFWNYICPAEELRILVTRSKLLWHIKDVFSMFFSHTFLLDGARNKFAGNSNQLYMS